MMPSTKSILLMENREQSKSNHNAEKTGAESPKATDQLHSHKSTSGCKSEKTGSLLSGRQIEMISSLRSILLFKTQNENILHFLYSDVKTELSWTS